MSDTEKRPQIEEEPEVGSGAVARGEGAKAAGARGVIVEGRASGPIVTGDRSQAAMHISQGLSEEALAQLFAPLMSAAIQAPPEKQAEAMETVEKMQEEAAKGEEADDSRLATLIDSFVEMMPGAVGAVVSTFATPILGALAGPVTKFVLDRLQR